MHLKESERSNRNYEDVSRCTPGLMITLAIRREAASVWKDWAPPARALLTLHRRREKSITLTCAVRDFSSPSPHVYLRSAPPSTWTRDGSRLSATIRLHRTFTELESAWRHLQQLRQYKTKYCYLYPKFLVFDFVLFGGSILIELQVILVSQTRNLRFQSAFSLLGNFRCSISEGGIEV